MSALYGTYARSNLAFERGEGVRLFAQDGTSYLDFHAGVAVNALGHGDPHMVAALKAAAEKVWHTANTFTIRMSRTRSSATKVAWLMLG